MASTLESLATNTSAPSNSLIVSSSPTATFNSPTNSFGGRPQLASQQEKHLKPFATADIKILLLENVAQSGIDILKGQNYQVETLKSSLPEDKLIEKIR
jgi:D-3-phosphoglycerate dehydrogenase